MKYICHLPLLFIFISACAQDSLFLKNNNVYAVTITSKNPPNVIFQKWNSPDSATIYFMPLRYVNVIKYSDGDVDSVAAKAGTSQTKDTSLAIPAPVELFPKKDTYGFPADKKSDWDYMYNKGMADADANYDPVGGIFGGAFASGFLLGPVLGLLPVAIVAGSDVPDDRLDCPDELLLKIGAYYQGYNYRAHRKKVNRAWAGYGVGVALEVAVGIVVIVVEEKANKQ